MGCDKLFATSPFALAHLHTIAHIFNGDDLSMLQVICSQLDGVQKLTPPNSSFGGGVKAIFCLAKITDRLTRAVGGLSPPNGGKVVPRPSWTTVKIVCYTKEALLVCSTTG